MAIVVAAVVGAQVLSVMGSGWQAKQRLTIELADGKLIQRRDGSVVAEMPVTEIQSLQQGWGWLVAKSGEKVITIPVQVVGYSQLRHELSAHAAITPLRLPGFLLALLQFGLTTAAWALLAFSHRRMVIEVSGIAALVFLTWGAFMARRRLRSKRAPVFLALCYGWSMVVTVWFIFVRLKAVP